MTEADRSRAGRLVPVATLGVIALAASFGGGWVVGSTTGRPARPVSRPVALPGPGSVLGAPSPPAVLPTDLPTGAITTGTTAAAESSATAADIALPAAGKVRKPPVKPFTCPRATDKVGTAAELTDALRQARPGDVIQLANGTYRDTFRATVSGTPRKPIYLCGGRAAVLDGGSVSGGYTLHLDHASYWRLSGFTVRNGQKGVMVDGATRIAVQDLLVENIGDEAIHLRDGTTNSVVRGNTVRDTGRRKPKFGEGVYIGSARSNWCTISQCRPDRSDRNFVLRNRISGTSSEAVDIKEGTVGGVVAGNTFDGSQIRGADSWVDVKGNGWLISGNRGLKAPTDGYQTHEIVDGWGDRNLFIGNVSSVGASGYAIKLTPRPRGNVVRCSNKQTGAGAGLSNTSCRS
jgi:parallel beta helix pectate lyase-like protein